MARATRIYCGKSDIWKMKRLEAATLLEDQRPGTVYWIDHYAVGTNDLDRWVDFHERVLGAETWKTNRPHPMNIFQELTNCRHGGFVQQEPVPPSKGPGNALPRYGFFIREE